VLLQARKNFESRSQTLFWLVAPVCIYIVDRCVLRSLSTHTTLVATAKLLHDPRIIVLRVARPAGFYYQCGQWAKLNFPALKSPLQWHPFSIASSPHDTDELEFIIRVIPGGWTQKLYEHIFSMGKDPTQGMLTIRIQGPYGGALQGELSTMAMKKTALALKDLGEYAHQLVF
jgi:predicted ferric reductase